MPVNENNIDALAAPAIETDDSLGSILRGLIKTGASLALEKEFAERTPPTSTTTNNRDTAAGELRANAQQFLTPRNITIGAVGIVAAAIAIIYAYKMIK